MARRKPKNKVTSPVAIRELWTIGGGGRFWDMFVFPPWVIIGGRIVKWFVTRPLFTLPILMLVLAWYFELLLVGSILVVLGMLAMCVWLYYRERVNHPQPTFYRIARGIYRIGKVKRKWGSATIAANLPKKPKLKKVRSAPYGVIGRVNTGKAGFSDDKLTSGSKEIAAVIGAHECRIEPDTPGESSIHLVWGMPTKHILTLHDIPQDSDPASVSFALDNEGYSVPLSLTTSTLIVGESESGKSTTIWSILAGLIRKNIPFIVRVIDLAGGVELNRLDKNHCPYSISYTKNPGESNKIVEYAYISMNERLEKMDKRGERKHTATKDEPLEILVIDELLLMESHGADSTLAKIISGGRKANHIVLAASQLSQVDALGRIRDLFPQRICLATKSRDMTDAVLGSGAESDGARCSKIGKKRPGTGYFSSVSRPGYTHFRTPFTSDEEVDVIAAGGFPLPQLSKGILGKNREEKRSNNVKRAVYRFFDRDYGLLYTGSANNPGERFKYHEKKAFWWNQVDHTKTRIVWYNTQKEAFDEEYKSIREENPRYNVAGVSAGAKQ